MLGSCSLRTYQFVIVGFEIRLSRTETFWELSTPVASYQSVSTLTPDAKLFSAIVADRCNPSLQFGSTGKNQVTFWRLKICLYMIDDQAFFLLSSSDDEWLRFFCLQDGPPVVSFDVLMTIAPVFSVTHTDVTLSIVFEWKHFQYVATCGRRPTSDGTARSGSSPISKTLHKRASINDGLRVHSLCVWNSSYRAF